MRMKVVIVMSVCALAGGASAMLAAPRQGTQTPGQPTQGRVLVQNHGKGEAVPIDLRDVNLENPLRVQVINGEPAFGPAGPVAVRVVRPQWEYKAISYTPAQESLLVGLLNGDGTAGWETTGIVIAKPEGTTVVLKRRR